MKKIFFPIFLLLICAILGVYFIFEKHESSSFVEGVFEIDEPYMTVLRKMSKKESLEEMIEEQNIKLIKKEWSKFEVEVPDRLFRIREYAIDGKLNFSIRKQDPDLGVFVLDFVQRINLNGKICNIQTELSWPNEKILICSRNIEIKPLNNKTIIKISSDLKIRKLIPIFFKKTMDERVQISNQKELENIKRKLIKLIKG